MKKKKKKKNEPNTKLNQILVCKLVFAQETP